ncbi:MAG: GNAT family N-acetyltransferase [Myxococcales bacterium]|nr:MAG: GNAT family N-acetyltransferase [Myxococcales bacterium]
MRGSRPGRTRRQVTLAQSRLSCRHALSASRAGGAARAPVSPPAGRRVAPRGGAVSVVIRPATPADAAHLPEVERSAGQTFLGSAFAYIADDPVTDEATHARHAAAGLEWVADADGVPVGFLYAEVTGRDLHVSELSVRHDRQRQGLGRALLDAAARAAVERGLDALTLTTFRDLAWNAPAYRRLGFHDLAPGQDAWLDRIVASGERRFGPGTRCAMRRALP